MKTFLLGNFVWIGLYCLVQWLQDANPFLFLGLVVCVVGFWKVAKWPN